MTFIVTAPVLPHTERQDEEAKANHVSGTNWYAMTILRTGGHREVHGAYLRAKTIGVVAKRKRYREVGLNSRRSNAVSPDIAQSFSRVCGCPFAPSVPAGNA